MRKILCLGTILSAFISVLLFSQIAKLQTQAVSTKLTPKEDIGTSDETFEPARKLLSEKGVSFDPEILQRPDWQKQIRLSPFVHQDFRTSFRSEKRIKGVLMADTLILPNEVELTGDTVIFANTIVFEGKRARIHGLGKNIYIYPVISTEHLNGTLEDLMRSKGIANNLPAINERTSLRFPLNFVEEETHLEIDVSGQGRKEWLAKQKNNELFPDTILELYCPPGNNDCSVYEPGATGSPGTGGQAGTPHNPPVQDNAPPGVCIMGGGGGGRRMQDGMGGPEFNGIDGDPGKTPSVADAGQGATGGTGGTINYTITSLNEVVTLLSTGGEGEREEKVGKADKADRVNMEVKVETVLIVIAVKVALATAATGAMAVREEKAGPAA